MATWKAEREYKCFDDCRMEGCPGHILRAEIQTTADILTVYRDKETLFLMDPNEWEKFIEIMRGWNYTFFPVEAPNHQP